VYWNRTGRRQGHPALSFDRETRQAGGSVRRQVSDHDFVLSNFINSGIYSVYVLTQFRSQSLLQHFSEGWQFGPLLKNQFVIPVPAQMRSEGETWYQGTADAIFQNMNLIEQADPHLVAIFGGDHIYRMNMSSMIEYHEQKSADVTVAAIPWTRSAVEFGVIETSPDGRTPRFTKRIRTRPPFQATRTRYASMATVFQHPLAAAGA
jgi:glucose-1-phosphate adenylyltransferase